MGTAVLLPGHYAYAADPSGGVVVTSAVQVTDNPAPLRAHSSPRIARNPENGELAVVEADVRGDLACKVHLSVDDGRSWFPGGDIMTKPDPVCAPGAEYGPLAAMAYGADGVLYVAYVAGPELGLGRDNTPRSLYLARSTDGGRNFAKTVVYDAPDGNKDLALNKGPTLAVDPNDSANVYVGWRQGVFRGAMEKLKSNVAASTDGGKTFGAPVDLTDDRGGDYAVVTVDGDGVVHAIYNAREYPPGDNPNGQDGPVRPIRYSRSTDKGKTFSPAKDIDPGGQVAPRPGVIVADPNSKAVYMAWHGNEEEMNAGDDFMGDYETFFRASLDGGETWGERKVLNDDERPVKVGQFHPNISIAPNGRVDVAWYDGRLSPNDPAPAGEDEIGFQDVFYTSSSDKGKTFGPNLRINDRSIDRSIGVYSNEIDSKTNVGITSTDDKVYFAWQDSRNANRDLQPEDIYTAVLALDGAKLAVSSSSSDFPRWWALAAFLLLGLGLGTVIASLLSRRSRPRDSRPAGADRKAEAKA